MVPVKEIMTTKVITVREDTPIYEALNVLTKNKVSGVPVVDDERHVKGILSEKDVLQLLMNSNVSVNATVGDYMSRKVVSFNEDDRITDVCELFMKSSLRRVPILKDGKLVGIVSRRDIVAWILEARGTISQYRFN